MPHCVYLSPLGTKHGSCISYVFLSRLVSGPEKALHSFIHSFIHSLNKHGVVAGLISNNILNMAPDFIDYNLLRERDTRQTHK